MTLKFKGFSLEHVRKDAPRLTKVKFSRRRDNISEIE
jgi:hypothetical protein